MLNSLYSYDTNDINLEICEMEGKTGINGNSWQRTSVNVKSSSVMFDVDENDDREDDVSFQFL